MIFGQVAHTASIFADKFKGQTPLFFITDLRWVGSRKKLIDCTPDQFCRRYFIFDGKFFQ